VIFFNRNGAKDAEGIADSNTHHPLFLAERIISYSIASKEKTNPFLCAPCGSAVTF
jgi:hypothetical protein